MVTLSQAELDLKVSFRHLVTSLLVWDTAVLLLILAIFRFVLEITKNFYLYWNLTMLDFIHNDIHSSHSLMSALVVLIALNSLEVFGKRPCRKARRRATN